MAYPGHPYSQSLLTLMIKYFQPLNYAGMKSKSLDQILRVSGVMHVLFSLEEENVDDTVTVAAINAAIHFVEVCCQQTAYIAER